LRVPKFNRQNKKSFPRELFPNGPIYADKVCV
jgi:hypothetical protein